MADPLHHEVLTGVVRKLERQANLVGLEEIAPYTDPVASNMFKWDEIHRNRDMAEFSDPDGKANVVSNQGEIERRGEVATIKEKKTIKGSTMSWLRKPGTAEQQYGLAKLRREVRHLNDRVDKREEWMVWEALKNEIDYKRPDDGYEFNITFNIPDDHQEAPSTLWSDTSSSKPAVDLLKFGEKISQDSGYEPTRVYMTSDTMRLLVQNDSIKNLMGESNLKEQVFETGQIQTLSGFSLRVYDGAYTDIDDNLHKFIGANNIVMLPDPSAPSDPIVERKIAPSTDPKADFQPGRFAKSWEEEDPARVNALVELNTVPVVQLPEAIYTTNVQ